MSFLTRQRRRRKARERRRERRERRRRRKRERQAELAKRVRSDPGFPLAVLLDDERRGEYMSTLGRRWGDWALETSPFAAFAALERPELQNVRIEGVSAPALACSYHQSVARRLMDDHEDLLARPAEGDRERALAHVIAEHHEALALELVRSPSRAARTFGTDRAVLAAALDHPPVQERVVEGPVAYGQLPADDGTAFHVVARKQRRHAERLLDREEVRGIEDEKALTVAESILAEHSRLIFDHLDLADRSFGGRDPLLHVAISQRPSMINTLMEHEEAAELLAVRDATGVPLAHRYVQRAAVAERALEDPAVGRLRDAEDRTARRAAVAARPGLVRALRSAHGALRERFGGGGNGFSR